MPEETVREATVLIGGAVAVVVYTKAIFSWSSALQSFLSPQDGRSPEKSLHLLEPILRTGGRLSTANGTISGQIRCTRTRSGEIRRPASRAE